MNLAICLLATARTAEAEREYEEARAILESTVGPDYPFLAEILAGLGTIRVIEGRVADGVALHRRALALGERVLGPAHVDLVELIALVAEDALREGRPDEARRLAERALALQPEDRTFPRTLSDLRFTLARALWEGGTERGRARALAESARTGYGERSARARADRARVDAWLSSHRAP
jgi:tetratricopeptide (TPR) repeat protein